ncbi:hypothetical protein WN943_021569 [Citrus x changshan-huyou]
MLLRNRLFLLFSASPSPKPYPFALSLKTQLVFSTRSPNRRPHATSASKTSKQSQTVSDTARFVRTVLFVPPGVDPDEVTEDMILPGSNIVVGPYAGHSQIKEVEFVKSSGRAKDCPKDDRPEFAILGRSNVGKSSLINALVRKKELALTSKKPGKTQLINHFLVNKSWYIVDLPGYGSLDDMFGRSLFYVGSFVTALLFIEDVLFLIICTSGPLSYFRFFFISIYSSASVIKFEIGLNFEPSFVNLGSFAKAPDVTRMDWSSFTKGYFLNRESLVGVLLLIDASVPPQKIDLDCANWLGRNNIPLTFVFTKCDKMKVAKGRRPDENIKSFQQLIRENYPHHPPWIMTSSVTGLGRDELLLHMSQLRNYWDQ